MRRSFSKDERVDKSLHHSIADGVAYSVMTGACDSYFSAYAVFLKATTPQIAILASLPSLLASFTQLVGVWIGQRTGARKGIIVAGALLQVFALAMVATLPEFVPAYAFPLLLLSVIFYFTGPNLGAPLWGSLMGAIVPPTQRGRFFAYRTRLASVASFSVLLVAGSILQLFDSFSLTYFGFLTIFVIGGIARCVSAWHLHQIHDPPHHHAVEGDVVSLFTRRFFKGQRRLLRFSVFFAMMQFAVAFSGPFVVVYLLRVLHFSYLELTFNTAASVLVQFLVLSRWGRLADLFGNRIILRLTGYTIAIIPFVWILSTDYWYLLLVQALSGLVWSGFSLSASNFIFDVTPQEKRAGLMAANSVLSSVAVFLGASTSGYLATLLPTSITIGSFHYEWLTVFYDAFVISTILRIIVVLIFLPRLEEVRQVRRMSYSGLIFRVTRFSPISGVIFDIVARGFGPGRGDRDPASDDEPSQRENPAQRFARRWRDR